MTSSVENKLRTKGLLAHLVAESRPELGEVIRSAGAIETAVYGLGQQGRRHAQLMRDYGTAVVAAVHAGGAAGAQAMPVYKSVVEMMRAHRNVAIISIWKHFATAPQAAMEAIEAGIPVVVLISEGVPVQEAQRLRAAAQAKNVLLFGPNTPGIIFPPERVKAGMLPDVFYAAEPKPGVHTSEGVTICSRSGAILYHMSDALAAAGISLNGVLGIGGDAVVGTEFVDLVPRLMSYRHTHAVVVAGEIGGAKEEVLAADMQTHPERYPKPVVALVSGRYAPSGKTMGHAGAIINPGAEYGTWDAKRRSLEAAGVTVVNGQTELVKAVSRVLGGKTYFDVGRYRAHMRALWDAPQVSGWETSITHIERNVIDVRDVPVAELLQEASFIDALGLLAEGAAPNRKRSGELRKIACAAALSPVPRVALPRETHLSQRVAALLLLEPVADAASTPAEQAAHCVGRVAACMAKALGNTLSPSKDFGEVCAQALVGARAEDKQVRRMLEAMLVASVDHGVTPPSAQATRLAASVRATLHGAVGNGLCAITHVHGGAGMESCEFYRECIALSTRESTSLSAAAEQIIRKRMNAGRRIEGLGHRVHTADPRREPLLRLAAKLKIAGQAVALSAELDDIFAAVRGVRLPLNVDGVIGAIISDLNLPPITASAVFMFGRAAGLCAHYFEETQTQQPMRAIDFSKARYVSLKGAQSS